MNMQMRVFFLLLFNIAVVISKDDRTKVELDPNNFVTLGDYTFYLGLAHDAITAANAQLICEENNMKLVTFQTEQKWLALREYLSSDGILMTTGFWTSGRYYEDLTTENSWQWMGNVPFNYTAWSAGFPSYYISPFARGNVCVIFSAYYSWMDTDCRKYDSYTLCE